MRDAIKHVWMVNERCHLGSGDAMAVLRGGIRHGDGGGGVLAMIEAAMAMVEAVMAMVQCMPPIACPMDPTLSQAASHVPDTICTC